MTKWFDARIQQRVAWGLLALVTLIYAVEMSHQVLLRYDTFKATAFDLGNMDQVLWNTLHGHPFQFSNQAIDWYGPPTRLAIHFEPILLPLSLLYVFHADPRILLIFQTLALTAGTLPVFLLTRKQLPEWPILAALMAGAYLLSPALLGLNIFDFHPVSFAAPLLLYAMLALTYKRYAWFIIACILAASCKEDIPLAIATLGLFIIWKYKLPRLGTVLIIGGLVWSFIAFAIIIPHFYPGVQHNNYWYRYEALGSSPGAALINLLIHPWLFFTTFLTLERVYYLGSLFRSTGFVSLLAPEWLLPALPSLAVNLLSTDPLLYSGVYHYNAAIIPFVMLSAIHGTRRFLFAWYRWREEKTEYEVTLQVAENPQGDRKGRPYHETVGLRDRLMVEATLIGADLRARATARVAPTIQRISLSRPYMVGAGLAPALVGRLKSAPMGATLAVALKIPQYIFSMARTLLSSFKEAQLRRLKCIAQWERFNARMVPLAKSISVLRLQWVMFTWITIMLGLNIVFAAPQLRAFWADHEPGSREQHIQQLLAMIPPDASVSAGDNLNPHLSERQLVTVFPSITFPSNNTVVTVQYIIVDLDSVFPEDRAAIASKLNQLVASKQFRILARAEGVELLVNAKSRYL